MKKRILQDALFVSHKGDFVKSCTWCIQICKSRAGRGIFHYIFIKKGSSLKIAGFIW